MAIQIQTKEEAFAPVKGLVSVPIDRSMHEFRFTRMWFRNRNQATFSSYLLPVFNGLFPINLLQIGCWEGADLVWQLQTTAHHHDSRVVVIDPWSQEANPKVSADEIAAVESRARHNLAPWSKKLTIIKGLSQDILPKLMQDGLTSITCGVPPGCWDLIIIDGDHHEDAVYQDAVCSLELARVGGWIVCDDVRNRITKRHHVKDGLQRFLEDYDGRVKRVWSHRYCEAFQKCS